MVASPGKFLMFRFVLIWLTLLVTPTFAQNAGDLYSALSIDPAVRLACSTLLGASIGSLADRSTWVGAWSITPTSDCLTAQAAVVAALNATPTSVAITSTATPSLNATYSISPKIQSNIQAISIYIVVNHSFPSGATLLWPDVTGALHTFPNTATFQAFATQIANYVTAIQLSQTPPSTPLSIP